MIFSLFSSIAKLVFVTELIFHYEHPNATPYPAFVRLHAHVIDYKQHELCFDQV